MGDWVYGFFMAWGMFLAIPCPKKVWRESARRKMLACLPLVGCVVGGVWALCACLVQWLPDPLAAALLAAAPWLADILDGAQARSALFLPLRLVRVPSVVTHPHGFLALPDKAKTPDDAWAFLMFCDALCAHPFYPLFWRSPVAAPYRSRITLGF